MAVLEARHDADTPHCLDTMRGIAVTVATRRSLQSIGMRRMKSDEPAWSPQPSTLRHVTRRQEFAKLLPIIVDSEAGGSGVELRDIYAVFERDHPTLVDAEIEASTGAIRWKHELRWELETLVVHGRLRRRKDLGRGYYSS